MPREYRRMAGPGVRGGPRLRFCGSPVLARLHYRVPCCRAARESQRSRILDGEDFSDLAKEYSEDPGSASLGGELGWLGKGVLAAEFEKVMIEIDAGEVSPVFQTQFGFHFLEVLDSRSYDMTRDLIEDRAYQILYGRKYDEELENTLRSMRAEAFVEIKDLD